MQSDLLRRDGADAIAEAHCLAQMTPPVSRLCDLPCSSANSAGEIGNQGKARRRQGHRRHLALKRLENGIHERGMERVRNDEPLAADALAGEVGAHLIHRGDRAGDDCLRRRVQGGYGDAAPRGG